MARKTVGARKTGSARKTATADVPVVHTGRPSDSTARKTAAGTGIDATVEPPTAAQRSQPHATGTGVGTSSGPQEKGPTRGARRPYNEVLPGFSRSERVVRVPTEDEEKFNARRKKAEADADAAAKVNLTAVTSELVVATRMGFYSGGRKPAGSEFVFRLRAGETLPSWVIRKSDYEQHLKEEAGAPVDVNASTRRGAKAGARGGRKTVAARAADRSATESGESAIATLDEDEGK